MPTFQGPGPISSSYVSKWCQYYHYHFGGCFLSKVLCSLILFQPILLPFLSRRLHPSFRASQAFPGSSEESSALWHPQRDNHTLASRCWPISFSQNGPEVGGRRDCAAPSPLALQAASNNRERDKLSLEASSVL